MSGHAPSANAFELSTNANAARAFASAEGSWVTAYTRDAAIESQSGSSLHEPQSGRAHGDP